MTRHTLFSILLLLGGIAPAAAQEGLQIASLFGGRYKDRADAIEVNVKGQRLREYKLTLFRSLTLAPTPQETRTIERMVQADCARAEIKEVAQGNHLYYGSYQLNDTGNEHRYIFYRNNALRNRDDGKLTLIYMEGTATLEDLKRVFAK